MSPSLVDRSGLGCITEGKSSAWRIVQRNQRGDGRFTIEHEKITVSLHKVMIMEYSLPKGHTWALQGTT